ncbi:hypothetical protein SOASR030_10480 [Leminorella grimontii]|uniref:GtrA-like protein domain-containing protein n=1 Tax=Leminorella grimontii TaxID=82981 RepID=A0AAV5MYK9_9GAMM|nr:hypothetical protein [Leminorella grimontii]GKX54936.1 hypothetical protein SOASR030_10480 [Leminorella grimontii]GKX61257.1 hypothetical protein SOASR031_35720 [Leminorella grimontii]VFS58061.1 Uncharacterised protein [Leminorella grimontii]
MMISTIKYLLSMVVKYALIGVSIHAVVLFGEAIFYGRGEILTLSDIQSYAPIGAVVGFIAGVINIVFRLLFRKA